MTSEIVTLTRELVERESENPPGNEQAVAEYLKQRLESSPVSFTIEVDEVSPGRPNVIARGGNPAKGTILLTGHTDVVPAEPTDWSHNPYELRVGNDRVIGRGTSDMKGALAAKILATEAFFERTEDPGEVILAFVVDEEVHGSGTQSLVEQGIDADVALIGEPTDLQVCVAQKGVTRFELTIHGESGHSGRPENATNAIDGMSIVLKRIKRLHNHLRDETTHTSLAPETITVTELKSGIAPNVVPDIATATVDWRFLPGTTDPDSFNNRLCEMLEDISLDGTPLDVKVEQTVFARGAEIPSTHRLVQVVQEAGKSAGIEADVVGFNAATDARYLVHDAGIPTVLFGPGSIEDDAHTVDESVGIADLKATVDTYREALTLLLS